MTFPIKLRTRVYSDCEVRSPEAYFNRVFTNYHQYWNLIESDDTNCILVETSATYEYDEDNIDDLYDSITPTMYESTSRSYVKV